MAGPLLEVEDLTVDFATDEGTVHAVGGVSFSLQAGEVLSIVGESGSGKSVTAMTILGLTRGPNARISGSVRYQGKELTTASNEELQAIRGDRIAMVFQDPMSSFNPVQKIGDQIVEAILAHRDMGKAAAHRKAVEALGSVGIPDPETRAQHYPFEFSGGMRQRAMIAMALALEPAILIADEPSTALDVTIQAQILELLKDLNQERGLSVILITHDLGVVAEIADRVLVMYAGQIVERGELDEIFYDPQHPYTWGLLGSIARLDQERVERLPQISRTAALADFAPARMPLPAALPARLREVRRAAGARGAPAEGEGPCRSLLARPERQEGAPRGRGSDRARGAGLMAKGDPLLEVRHLVKHFPIKSGILFDREVASVKAVDDCSLTLHEGETLGLVGESGCGKSTLCRTIIQLLEPTSGSVLYHGRELVGLSRRELRPVRREIQMIFQDPYASLNPRKRVGQIIGDPIAAPRARLGDAAAARGPGADGQGRPPARALQPLPA